jgi:hypothetical protein
MEVVFDLESDVAAGAAGAAAGGPQC